MQTAARARIWPQDRSRGVALCQAALTPPPPHTHTHTGPRRLITVNKCGMNSYPWCGSDCFCKRCISIRKDNKELIMLLVARQLGGFPLHYKTQRMGLFCPHPDPLHAVERMTSPRWASDPLQSHAQGSGEVQRANRHQDPPGGDVQG